MPEGVPEQDIIQQTTDGFMKGFFVTGAAVDITDTAHPDVLIHINLHQCLAENSQFFKEIWMALWNVIARLAANKNSLGQDMSNMFHSHNGGQPQWAGELMVAMMQFPM